MKILEALRSIIAYGMLIAIYYVADDLRILGIPSSIYSSRAITMIVLLVGCLSIFMLLFFMPALKSKR